MRDLSIATTGDADGFAPMLQWRVTRQRFAVVAPDEAAIQAAAAQAASRVALGRAIRANLAAWREAELELTGIAPQTPAWRALNQRLAGHRSTYRSQFDEYLALPSASGPSRVSRARQKAPTLLPGPWMLARWGEG